MEQIKMSRDENWLPPFRAEYDGIIINIFGKSKDFDTADAEEQENAEVEYQEVRLSGLTIENVNADLLSVSFDEEFIYISFEENDN